MAKGLEYQCKVCEQSFKSERSLHAHIKAHGVLLADYYVTYYPRFNLYSKEPIPFKNKSQYFSTYFFNSDEIDKWVDITEDEEVKDIILKMLKDRIVSKDLKYAPNHLDLLLNNFPSINIYKRYFGSYNEACRRLQVEPIYNKAISKKFFMYDKNLKEMEIMIDTREQTPLSFPNGKPHKLDFGDYTASGENYNKTYVDRKSEVDFKSTMTVGYDRFIRELERASSFDSFLYIVIETSVEKIIRNNSFGYHKSNLKFVWHQMRKITHMFPRVCQFIFSGGRNRSKILIPLLLRAGPEVWNSDIQYYIDNRKIKL
jgi:hypothetical protein